MKRILFILALLASPLCAQNAGNTTVTKKTAGNLINEDLVIGSGRTLNVAAGTITFSDNQIPLAKVSGALSTTAAAAAYQPLDSDLTGIAALSTTSFGRSLLTQADAAALRVNLSVAPMAVTEQAAQIWQFRHAYDKIYSINAGTPARLKCATVGDSVAGSLSGYVGPMLGWSLGNAVVTSPTWVMSGDAWTADGSEGKLYDYSAFFTGVYHSIGSGTGTVWWGSNGYGPTADRAVVFYLKSAGSGHIKLQVATNNPPSAWADIAGYEDIDTSGTGYGKIVLTQAAGNFGIRAVHLSGGRAKLLTPIYDNSGASGVSWCSFSRGGLGLNDAVQWDPALAADYIAEADLDLAFFEVKENSSYYAAALASMQALFDSGRPTTDWCFIGSTPIATGDADQVEQNRLLRLHALASDRYYFDSYSPLKDYATLAALGWQGDGTHVSDRCRQYLAGLLADKLQPLFLGTTGVVPMSVSGNLVRAFDSVWLGTQLRLQRSSSGAGGAIRYGGALSVTNPEGTYEPWRFSTSEFSSSPSWTPVGFRIGGVDGPMLHKDGFNGAVHVRTSYNGTPLNFVGRNTPAWRDVVVDTTFTLPDAITANKGGSQMLVALPATCPYGTVLRILGIGTGGWRVTQGSGQQILGPTGSSTSGASGYIEGPQGSAVELLCITANTTYRVLSMTGAVASNAGAL